MNEMPAIGTRVRYRRMTTYSGERTVIGTVVKQWPGYTFCDDGSEIDVEPSASVKVDARPAWWPYPETDVFAPGIEYLEPIEK